MLKQNVYLLYPAGFSGSYVRWAISISDRDLRAGTPLDPINQQQSSQFGGVGTPHTFVRVPTHQSIYQHLNWVLANRPADKRVYLINVDGHGGVRGDPELAAGMLLRHDPESIIVNIHDGNDALIAAYGNINCVTKWPTYLALVLSQSQLPGFDAFNCNTREFRNFIVLNHGRPQGTGATTQYVTGDR